MSPRTSEIFPISPGSCFGSNKTFTCESMLVYRCRFFLVSRLCIVIHMILYQLRPRVALVGCRRSGGSVDVVSNTCWVLNTGSWHCAGQGFDRHLFALRLLAEERGGTLPAIFQDPSFTLANHFTLSTSTLHGTAFSGGGFAPVVPDGYGLGYGMVDGHLGALVSAYSPHRDAAQYAAALFEALDRISTAMAAQSGSSR